MDSPDAVLRVLLGGLRVDTSLVSYALLPSVILALTVGDSSRLGSAVAKLRRVYLGVIVVLFIGLEALTPSYITEFDGRPDRVFIEGLRYPREVSSMLWTGHRTAMVTLSLVCCATIFATYWAFRQRCTVVTHRLDRLLALCLIIPTLAMGARGTLQHRPINPSTVVFSEDPLLNDLCLSSLYSVAYAALQTRSERDAAAVYGSLVSDAEVVRLVRASMVTVASDDYTSEAIPTLHRQRATRSHAEPLNLVVILEESLGAQYVSALGGRPITRFLDTLIDQGWWFERMYATGTRSVRGIEAVVTGFPPTPARAVVKLGLAQRGFFTLAALLEAHGYHSRFVYGGESHFDNMKRFFAGNGFSEIYDRGRFDAPRFEGSWGVSDGDMFNALHTLLEADSTRPSFTLAFTVSNHSPWEYPEDDFVPEGDARTVENAVRYADHELGRFFERARNSSYWGKTLFVIVADHDARVHGAELVPIERFHIPAVIIGPGVPKLRDPRVVSQIDLGPTLLSLLGISSEHPMIGHDLTQLPLRFPGRAIMQYGDNQAYMEGDQVVILQPSRSAAEYTWVGNHLQQAISDPALRERALAHALLPSYLYRQRAYRLPRGE